MKKIFYLTTVCCYLINYRAERTRIGGEDFKTIVTSPTFIDKTMFIKEFLRHRMVQISVPRCFGKSVNMNMLKSFLTIQTDKNGVRIPVNETENYKMFTRKYNGKFLKVYQDKKFFEENFGKYPVLHVSFKDLRGENMAEFFKSFSKIIKDLLELYPYLLRINQENPFSGKQLRNFYKKSEKCNLCRVDCCFVLKHITFELYDKFKVRVIVLIDDYDAVLQQGIFNPANDTVEIIRLIDRIIGSVAKGNEHVFHCLFNSCMTRGGSVPSCANTIQHYHFLDNRYFGNYYGFTQEDVETLLSRFHMKEDEKIVREWYGGYYRGDGIEMYNPHSIVQYCKVRVCDNYWRRNDTTIRLRELSYNSEIFETVCALLQNKTIKLYIDYLFHGCDIILLQQGISNPSNFGPDAQKLYFSILRELGYLTIVKGTTLMLDEYQDVKIPNKEIKEEIKRILDDRLHNKEM